MFDPALPRHGATDGGWWPRSQNALTELPALLVALDARPGLRVQRLAVPRCEWDELPRQLTADGSHLVPVDRLTTIPRHTVSVTVAGGREPIVLLVVPPDTPAEAAWADMNIAATSPGIPQTTDILTPEELQSTHEPVPGDPPAVTPPKAAASAVAGLPARTSHLAAARRQQAPQMPPQSP